MNKIQKSKNQTRDTKGVALIIVIFAMMLFAVLGWTLARMQSTDFEADTRNFDSEETLNLAETGAQYALNQLSQDSSWRTCGGIGSTSCASVDSDCNDNGDWLNAPHNLGSGQYNLCCRNPANGESGNAVIEARGYIPQQASYRAMRSVKIEVTLGNFDKVLQAKNIFDWSNLISNRAHINGDTQALYYNRNNINPYNEAEDLAVPDGNGDTRDIAAQPYPSIDMAQYESEAGVTWAPPGTAKITAISTVGGRTQLDLDSNIVTAQWNTQGLRNISQGSWENGTWEQINNALGNNTVRLENLVSWAIGDRVTIAPKIASIDSFDNTNGDKKFRISFDSRITSSWTAQEAVRNFSRTGAGTWNYREWGVIDSISTVGNTRYVIIRVDDSVNLAAGSPDRWATGEYVGEAKRYRNDVISGGQGTLYYIMGDVIFDVRNRQPTWENNSIDENILFRRTALISEGDLGIRGTQRITFSDRPYAYPSLATKNGNIISPDAPDGGNGDRNFRDLVYTENGDLVFNYLRCRAAFGNNVTLSGDSDISYNNITLQLTGFTWGLSDITWREE